MKVLWYQNISQDYRDYIKTFRRNQVWQESWPDCRVSSQPFQQQQCQPSELPCSSSQTFQAVLILWTFPLWDSVLQVLQPSLPSLSVPAAGWADGSLLDLPLLLLSRKVADTAHGHFTSQEVQQYSNTRNSLSFLFYLHSKLRRGSKRCLEVKEMNHFKVLNDLSFEKSRSSASLLYTSSVGGRVCHVEVLSLAVLFPE